MRPATPGFIITLLATVLLALVSFSVPWFKFVYFLKASLSVEGISGSITFGVLGYCVQLSNGTTCSKPSIGYELGKTPSISFTFSPINLRLIHRYRQAGGRQY
jgi:SUR7/PalI family